MRDRPVLVEDLHRVGDSTAMTADRHAAPRAVALLAAVVLAIVAALAVATSPAVADSGPAAETRVAASDQDGGVGVGAEPGVWAGGGRGTTTPGPGTVVGSCVAPNTTGNSDCVPDHIVLGLEAFGLRETAARVGGRHLLDDPNWRFTFLAALGDPTVRFTLSLDGLDGANPTEQLRTAVHRGAGGSPSPTNWEVAQLHQAGRLPTTSLVEDRSRRSVPNPWPATGFPP